MKRQGIPEIDDELPATDLPHAEAALETGFWGRQGAGCIILARSTGRLLIALRSQEVLEPLTWGTWGGAINEGLAPEEAVRLEILEETGYDGEVDLHPVFVYQAVDCAFRYHNFLAVIDDEFEPELNWESDGFAWVELDEFPKDLHFGLKALTEHADFSQLMGILLEQHASAKP